MGLRIFTHHHTLNKDQYLVIPSDYHDLEYFSDKDDIALPLVYDTEFKTCELKDARIGGELEANYMGLCTQFKVFGQPDTARIIDHPDLIDLGITPRHTIATSDFFVTDYLNQLGVKTSIRQDRKAHESVGNNKYSMPAIMLLLCGHFAIVDLFKVVLNGYWDDLTDLVKKKKIKMDRHLCAGGYQSFINVDWVMTIEGKDYRVRLKPYDTIALNGFVSYKDLAANTGVSIPHKSDLDKWKSDMDKAYVAMPEIFDQYALGDLHLDTMLYNYADMMRKMYEALGIEEYYRPPKRTIGSTQAHVKLSLIAKMFNHPPEKLVKTKDIDEFLYPLTGTASALHLSTQIKTPVFMLSKCDGGRCNRWLVTIINIKVGYDIDIGGAYGSTMSRQPLPFGILRTRGFENGNRITLRQYLKENKRDLIDLLWVIRISTTKPLLFEQDLISSWYNFGKTTRTVQDQGSFITTGEVNLDSGDTRIFTTEIKNVALTSDLLSIVQHAWTKRQRDDFLDNVVVESVGWYSPKDEYKNVNEWEQAYEKHNHAKSEFYGWFSVQLGEFLIDKFRALRNMHPKKTPLNILYKLATNTGYGVAISKYFTSSNMIVGANITASVRTYMWCLEKALYLTQSITDGGAGSLQKVVHPHPKRKKINTEYLPRLYQFTPKQIDDKKMCRLAPIVPDLIESWDGDTKIITVGDKVYRGKDAENWVNKTCSEHVQKDFPDVPVVTGIYKRLVKRADGIIEYEEGVGLFDLEMKTFFKSGTFHGASNYKFDNQVSMRSYEGKKPHQAVDIDDNEDFIWDDTYNKDDPAKTLLTSIEKNCCNVPQQPPFYKQVILKTADFVNKHRYAKLWSLTNVSPGDMFYKRGKVSLYSPSQFSFRSEKQYHKWQLKAQELKRKYGVAYEIFFTNDDGTVDFQRMVITLDKMISEGVMHPLEHLDKHNNIARKDNTISIRHMNTSALLKDRLDDKILDADKVKEADDDQIRRAKEAHEEFMDEDDYYDDESYLDY